MGEISYLVIEDSPAGQTVVGIYSSLELARAQLPSYESGRLFDFRIQAQVIDAAPEPMPWQVALSSRGDVLELAAYIGCSSCPEPDNSYYVEPEDDSLHVVVWALTPGEALSMARYLSERLATAADVAGMRRAESLHSH